MGGKRKIEIKKIESQKSRMVAFSKRRKGLFKKAGELSSLSGAKIAIRVFSPAGKPFSFDTHHLLDDQEHQETAASAAEAVGQWVRDLDVEALHELDHLLFFKQQLELAKDTLTKQQPILPILCRTLR